MIDVTTFDSYHHLLKGKLLSSKSKKYHQYVKERKSPKVDIFALETLDGPSDADTRLKVLSEELAED